MAWMNTCNGKRNSRKKIKKNNYGSSSLGPRYLSGSRARRAGWKLKANFLKYLVHRRRFPLFILRASRGGILANREMLKAAKLCKIVAFSGTYRFSLTAPRWPSAAFDRMAAGGGLNLAAAGSGRKRHIDMAILGITRKCGYRCEHCYQASALSGDDSIPIARWQSVIRELQDWGTGIIVLSGGEPLLRLDGIFDLLRSADHDLSEFHLHTSGMGLNDQIAAALCRSGLSAAGVGLDDFDPLRHDRMRGTPGAFASATQACRILTDAGIFTYLNTCLSPGLVRDRGLFRLLELARDLGVGIVRLLEPRPCGSYFTSEAPGFFSGTDRQATAAFHEEANTGSAYQDFPLVSYEAYIEHPDRLGCRMGGLSHFAIDSLGNVLPCVFLPVTFGNIQEEGFKVIYQRLRAAVPRPVRKNCPAVSLAPLFKTRARNLNEMPISIASIKAEWKALFN